MLCQGFGGDALEVLPIEALDPWAIQEQLCHGNAIKNGIMPVAN